jgi:hypothetical protein
MEQITISGVHNITELGINVMKSRTNKNKCFIQSLLEGKTGASYNLCSKDVSVGNDELRSMAQRWSPQYDPFDQ